MLIILCFRSRAHTHMSSFLISREDSFYLFQKYVFILVKIIIFMFYEIHINNVNNYARLTCLVVNTTSAAGTRDVYSEQLLAPLISPACPVKLTFINNN